MKIGQNSFVGIEYKLTLDSGQVIDETKDNEALGFIFGAGQVVPGLEKAIEGMDAGESTEFTVSPEEGYGMPREELINEIPRENFPEDMKIDPDMLFQAHGPQGPTTLRVVEAKDDVIVADFNHPLSGETLNFSVKIVDVHEATEEERGLLEQHA
jgi:FKBP-type peptidyl-prolyl cis-trans isomerase SlyD